MRTIMLIDMDYFYVACEELRHPEIRDKPAVVGMDPKGGKGRGVVMTCNYKAREFGLKSGMPISAAYKLKPDAIYLKLDYDYYDEISRRIMDVAREFADGFEQVSVDEAFMNVSARVEGLDPKVYAEQIKKAVFDRIGMRCSIGIGPNKLIAKMACERAKPNGIKMVKETEVKEFLKGLEIEELYGVGAKTAERLEKLGYKTVDELAMANMVKIVGEFGSFGADLVRYANGIDESEVAENYGVKSVGKEFTFENDTDNDNEIIKEIGELSNGVMAELNKSQEHFKTVTLKLRYNDFVEHLHSKSVKVTNDPDTLKNTAIQLYKDNFDRQKKVRKLGVRASNLVSYKGQRRIV